MIHQNEKPNQFGFTLMEVIIVLGIGSLLMLVILLMFDSQFKDSNYQQAQLRVTGSARNTMGDLTKFTSQALNVEATRTFSGTSYTSDADTLILKLPSINSSYAIIPSTYDYILFDKSGSNLTEIVEIGAGSIRKPITKKLSGTVQSFTITYNKASLPESTLITVSLHNRLIYKGTKYVEITLANTIFLRNKLYAP